VGHGGLLRKRSFLFYVSVPPGRQVVKNEHSLYYDGMPKVTDAHRAARRRQILDAAGRCFVRNGFHATSMQDVLHEAGLSAGAVYRYFPGKAAIVTAIAEETVADVERAIEETVGADPVPPVEEAMARVLDAVDAHTGPQGNARIAVQVWAEALREPALADLVQVTYARIRSRFVELASRAREAGRIPADADPEQVGTVLFGMLPGYILQRLLVGGVDPAVYRAGLRAVLVNTPLTSGPAAQSRATRSR
jgi:AcrR family transcriptional regulator